VIVKRARAKYEDRDSEEGQEAHRKEEKERRDRRALERVGDQRCPEEAGDVREGELATNPVVKEATDAQEAPAVPVAPVEAAKDPEPVSWVLVAWPEVLEASRERVGTEARCPYCGRHGRIERVVSPAEWRRTTSRGVAWE
jgi:hypothetical protein